MPWYQMANYTLGSGVMVYRACRDSYLNSFEEAKGSLLFFKYNETFLGSFETTLCRK